MVSAYGGERLFLCIYLFFNGERKRAGIKMSSNTGATNKKNCYAGRKRELVYDLLCVIAIAAFGLAVISAGLSFFPSWPIAAKFRAKLEPLFVPKAMAAVVSFIGFAGVAFAWMVARVEDRVCGLRLYEIVTSAFQWFFGLYFILYLSASIVVIYAGNTDYFWPAVYAFISVLCVLVLMSYVCYRIVIRSDIREDYAFAYCEDRVSKAEEDAGKLQAILLNVSEYVRSLYITEHRDISKRMVHLWLGLFKPNREEAIKNSQSNSEVIFRRSNMLCRAWAALLPNGLANYQDMAILRVILGELDKGDTTEEAREARQYSRWIALLGLAQYLIRYCQKSSDWNLRYLQSLSYEMRGYDAFQESVWAFLSMLAVEWIKDESPHPRKALAEAVRAVLPVLDACVDDARVDKEKKELLTVTAIYAQRIAGEMRKMTLISYYVRLARLFQSTVIRENIQKELLKPENQIDRLSMLFYIAVMEEKENEAKRAS